MLTYHQTSGPTTSFRGLGSFPASSWNCFVTRNNVVCDPLTAPARDGGRRLQRAIDQLLNILPLFRTPVNADGTPRTFAHDPVGTIDGRKPPGTGYDGQVGPNTRGLGEIALAAAAQLWREAGQGDPPAEVSGILALPEAPNFARGADDVATFLETVVSRSQDLIAAATAARTTSQDVFQTPPSNIPTGPLFPTNAPPIIIPPDVTPQKKGHGLVIGLSIAGAAIFGGLVIWATRKKDDDGYQTRRMRHHF
jgi:hypothetical protein